MVLEELRDEDLGPAELEALGLLLKCIDATEAEDRLVGGGVAPGYYEDLAVLCRKERRFADEVAILERFEKQRKGPGVLPGRLAVRLVKVRELLQKAGPRQVHRTP